MGKTILAIEDDPQIAELLELLLESPEVKILHFTSGREGWEAVQKQNPELVILDVKVPDMTGWEVLDAIRTHDTLKETPVIMLSVSQPDFERKQLFSQSKINFYLAKPFDVLVLRRKIKEILEVTNWQVADSKPDPRDTNPSLRPIAEKLLNATTANGTEVAKSEGASGK